MNNVNIHLVLADGRSNILKVSRSFEKLAARYFSGVFLGAKHMSQVQFIFLTKKGTVLSLNLWLQLLKIYHLINFACLGLPFHLFSLLQFFRLLKTLTSLSRTKSQVVLPRELDFPLGSLAPVPVQRLELARVAVSQLL